MQKLSRSLFALGGLAALAACGDDVSITPPPEPVAVVTSVTVSPASLTIRIGEKATLGVSVATTAASVATTVTWSSSTPAVATVSATGEVTGVAVGTTTVRATSTADVNKSGAAQVSVTGAGVRSVSVSPQTLGLTVGGTATAVATVDRDAGVAATVTWASNNTAVATVAATTGLITAVAPGTAVITATSTVDASKSASLAVTVSPVAPNLTALSVAPTSANLGIGSTVQLVPSATTVGTPTVTFTYSTSNAAVATVSATGLVTAIGNGTAVITTTATTSTNSLSVATTINVASASVSISSITQMNLPVNIANVAGQFEVTMNISAGNQVLDSVRVLLDDVSAATQGFTVNGAPNAPVTLSINSAAYTLNADSTSTVRFLNKPLGTVVKAELFAQNASGPTASNTITIVLNNADTFHARWTLPANSATSAAGFLWYGGPGTSTTLNVIPVMYSGNVVTSATFHMDDASVDGNASLCGAAVTDTASPFVAAFTCTGVTNTTVQPGVAASLRADGNAGPAGVVVQDPNLATPATLFANANVLIAQAMSPVRIDVAGPAVGTPFLTPQVTGQIIGWVNATHSFGSLTSTSPLFLNSVDAGVGIRATRDLAFQYQGCPYVGVSASKVWVAFDGTGNTVPECATDFTGGATPGPYESRAQESDRLGNLGTSALTGRYGVDKTAPSARYGTGSSADRSVDVASRTFIPEGFDDRAGFDPNAALSHFLATANGTTATTGLCAVGTTGTGGIGTAFVTNPNCVRTTVAGPYLTLGDGFNQIPAAVVVNTAGYWHYNFAWTDQAGNTTAPAARIVAVDPALPAVTGLNVPAGITGAVFPAFAMTYTDDVEGIDFSFGLSYPAVGVLRYPRTAQNTRFDDVISTPGQFVFTSPYGLPFARRIEIVDGANNVQTAAVTDPTAKPAAVQGTAFDVLGSASAPFSSSPFVAVLPGNVQTGVAFEAWNIANPTNAIGQWLVIPLAAGFNAPAGVKAQVVTGTNSTNAPFVRVDFYRVNAGEWYYLASQTSAIPGNNVANRFWTYMLPATIANTPFNTTPQATPGAGEVIIAIGVTAAGDGLSTLSTILVP